MSRQAEAAYGKWRTLHEKECLRDLVIGARVYRAYWDRIEEGEVCRISRVGYTSDGREYEDKSGPYTCYHANFRGTYESQTHQWKWFFKIADAERDLVRQLRRRAEDSRRDAAKWEDLAATFDVSAAKEVP